MPKRRNDKNGKPKLTPRERLFVEYVAQGKSLTQAALDAGYSPDYAGQIGSENYKKPEIEAAVSERVSAVAATTDEVLSVLAMHLRADVADFEGATKETGELDLVGLKERGVSRLVKKVRTRTRMVKDGDDLIPETTTEIEIHDSQAAAWKLAELLGMKKEPATNPEDVRRVKNEIERLIEEGWTQQQAREIVLEADPRAAQWLN
jgi:phage terminase small subunit